MLFFVFIVLVTFSAIDFAVDKKLFSPAKLFNSIWLLILFLYLLDLSKIQTSLSDRAVTVFLVCVMSFNFIYYISRKIFLKKKKENKEKKSNYGRQKWIDKGSFVAWKASSTKVLKTINICFIIMFAIEIIYSGYLPMISLFQGASSNYLNFGIPSVNGLMYAIAICLGAYYIFKKDPRALIYIIFGVLVVSRQLLISMAIEALFLFICMSVHSKRKIKHLWLKVVAAAVLFVAGFTIIGNVRTGGGEVKRVFEPRSGYEELPTSVMWVYSYLEFSLSNFNKLTELTAGGVNYGASTLSYVLPTAIENKISIPINFRQNYLVRPNFNVSTWFPEIYLDFGIIGVGLFSGLVALLGWILYRNVLEKVSIRSSLLYAVFAHNILMFFFVNMFLYLPVVAQFIIIPLIFRRKYEEC